MSADPTPLAGASVWDLVASGYTRALLPQFEWYARDAIAAAALVGTQAVIDVACGPGTLALLAAQAGARPIVAVDFSRAMIAALAARVRAAALPVHALVGDAQALPLAGARFDRAFCLFGLMFFPDPDAGLRELFRVLRPGGRAIIATWAPFEGPLAAVADRLLEHAGLPATAPALPFSAGDDLSRALAGAGFTDVAVDPISHDLGAPSVARFWQDEQETPLVARVRRQLGEAAWAGVAARVLADLSDRYGPGPLPAPATAWLAVATRPPGGSPGR